ncbi:MAG: hypothetical protein NTV92_06570 [Candidatus Bipolaricaulota bacterium]|nr:hypothetical protein [Candidatus Bipolaricaulota bacterium]
MPSAPVMVEKTSIIRLDAPLAQAFPLFGPLREREWAEGWNPEVVWPATESIQERMVFIVRSPHGHGHDSTWLISRYAADGGLLEYTVFSPDSVHWILIRCRAVEDGRATEAEITYTYVGTSEDARFQNERALETIYHRNLKDWEEAINHYLRTGQRIAH